MYTELHSGCDCLLVLQSTYKKNPTKRIVKQVMHPATLNSGWIENDLGDTIGQF